MIPGSANPLLLASAAEAAGYEISRSVRFNSSDSAYLSRTPASAGNRKTWTFACWLKKGKNSISQSIFSELAATEAFRFDSDALYFYSDTGFNGLMVTNAILRDPSAWYHVLLSVDTTQATAENRANIYINGVLQTLSPDTRPAQNYDTLLNSATALQIGGPTYFDGYLADIHFIDGQALDPTSFGEFDDNGIWQPKAYTGTYPGNSFHLTFSDNSTAASLGDDTSGNGNNWTVNNISVAAGAGNDSLVDVPTNGTEADTGLGGEVRGNYATWNPLALKGNTVLSNGNLDVDSSSTGHGHCGGTIAVTSGKWYWEITKNTNTLSTAIGLGGAQASLVPNPTSTYIGNAAGKNFIYLQSNIVYMYDGVNATSATSSSAANDSGTFMFALDMDNAKFWVGKDGTWFQYGALSGGDPGTGSNPVFTQITSGVPYLPIVNSYTNGNSLTANFGQRPFAYTAPSGFKALCTTNLPDPLIAKPSEVMDVKLYTGNGSTQTISGLGFSPDLVWIKSRSQAFNHGWYDIVRGATKRLISSSANAEDTLSGVTAFNSDGFEMGGADGTNGSTYTYVAWAWDAGSSTVTNTQGSITSQVRANPSAGFSIVTYTGTGSALSFGHGLGVQPQFFIIKQRNAANYWAVGHSYDFTKILYLNTTDSAGSSATAWPTAPTSSVINLGTSGYVNVAGDFIAYCFAPVAGYSAFGSYTGNGVTDGPFVYTGFRPRFILIKRSDGSGNWLMLDSIRLGYNASNNELQANLVNAEGAYNYCNILSNGFKIQGTDASGNTSGSTYVYYAVAEHPFQYARAR